MVHFLVFWFFKLLDFYRLIYWHEINQELQLSLKNIPKLEKAEVHD